MFRHQVGEMFLLFFMSPLSSKRFDRLGMGSGGGGGSYCTLDTWHAQKKTKKIGGTKVKQR